MLMYSETGIRLEMAFMLVYSETGIGEEVASATLVLSQKMKTR
jgi:hypothetical protein